LPTGTKGGQEGYKLNLGVIVGAGVIVGFTSGDEELAGFENGLIIDEDGITHDGT